MFDQSYEEEVAAVARDLWREGVRALAWSNQPTSKETPWAESWADVYIKEICEPLQANWLATIVSLDDDQGDAGFGVFKIKQDAELVFEFEGGLAATKKTYIKKGQEPLEIEIEKELDEDTVSNKFYWDLYRREKYRDPEATIPTYRVPVWSAEIISKTVSGWLEQISGHRFQLKLDEEVTSPFHAEIQERFEEIVEGKAETFDLGDGVRASSKAFDELLADPDVAADVTAELKSILPAKED